MKMRIYRKPMGTAVAVAVALMQWVHAQSIASVRFAQANKNQLTAPAAQSLKKKLQELEERFNVRFTYKNALLEDKTVQGAAAAPAATELAPMLKELLTPHGLRFKKIDDIYVIYPADDKPNFKQIKQISNQADQDRGLLVSSQWESLALPKAERLQSFMNPKAITVSGRVTNETGEGLPGVSVAVKGTTTGTTTNGEGRYTLGSVPENGTLVFSFIGYVTEEVAVANRTTIDITMAPDLQSLNEVVVVGYGTQKKSSVVAAISSVSSKEINALPVPSVEQALQGRAAGVIVTNNGAPGETPIVRIRGVNSINFASNPLYVVDGIPQVGNFNLFDNRDIESVEVLKDANSAAIYGSRAAAGVILITTKKGSRDGKVHVNLDSYVGTQSAWRQLDIMNRDEYVRYGSALLGNAGAALPPRFATLNTPIYEGTTQTFAQTETDWQKEMFRAAPIVQHNLSVSGGNEKSRFYTSGGYFRQDGIMLGTSFERYNLRLNSDHQIMKGVTLGQTLFVGYGTQISEQNPGGRSQIQNMIRMTPYIPVFNPTNLGGYGGATGADASDPQNPVRAALQDISRTGSIRVLGTIFLEVDIFKGLKYRFNVGGDFATSRNYGRQPIYSEGFNSRPFTTISDSRNNYFSPVYTNQLTFDRTFGKHYINAIGVIEYQRANSVSLNASGQSLSIDARELDGLNNRGYTARREESAIFSYIGRVNYEYANKYLFSASVRRDGASQFAPGRKFGNFPSIGVGWRISEEGFMKNVAFLSEAKIRASYGSMGFIPGNYLWQSVINPNTETIIGGNRVPGAFYERLGNRDLQWEITNMFNVGIDAGFLRNRITFSAEYFDRNTDNLILDVSPAISTGYSVPTTANIGRMRNWGYEFQATYNETRNAFRWSVSANLGVVRNRVNALESPTAFLDRGGNADFGGFDITRTVAGLPVQSFFGWMPVGIFQSQAEIFGTDGRPAAPVQNLPLNSDGTVNRSTTGENGYNNPANAGKFTRPGDIRFADLNNDGRITADDRTFLGSFLPDFTYGINFSANYKNFDLTMFFQGVHGNEVFNGVKVIQQGMLRLFNASPDVLRAWTPQNTNTDVPRAVNGDPNNNSRTSTRFIEDGSYLRLKNLSIGYTIPAATLQRITGGRLGNFRVYVASQNLLTFTRYTGYDPEIGSRFNSSLTQGIDYGQFPQARTLMVGLQAGF